MKETKYLLASAFNIFRYDILVKALTENELKSLNVLIKKFIEDNLQIHDAKLFSNNHSQYIYLWKSISLQNAQSNAITIISGFHNQYDKLNFIDFPRIELTIGLTATKEDEILENNEKALALIKNVSILSENCILYGVNNLISEELLSEHNHFREIDKRIFYMKNDPTIIYSLIN
ncbi:hypothetical protein [Leptospira kanakyensis]|uniref:hypothetical protein n=1 Tax=Leptospira kanakyensis TaxID=2484968 RepID=UPI00223D2EB1|nr:hypothetical protein [Leptospira kanakyensis]MCW7471861.1 hypothetical protein [Leptospira kanakyensis]